MTEPITDIAYWQKRLASAYDKDELHQAIFRCPLATWQAIETKHHEILSALTRANDSILDVGCAWGRLISLMPRSWQGDYLGLDISPDFIRLAQTRYQHRYKPESFMVFDLRELDKLQLQKPYDWAIMISMKPMISRNLGSEVWDAIEYQLRRKARRLLFLEYDVNDDGSVVNCEELLIGRKIPHE